MHPVEKTLVNVSIAGAIVTNTADIMIRRDR